MTNLDALWLRQLSDEFARDDSSVAARLLRIADNLQRLDEQNALLKQNQSFEAGVAAAEARMRARSNLLPANPEGEDAEGASLLDQINRRVAEGNVRRIAAGERALEDKPHLFNAPRRRQAKPKTPTIDLDLDFLGDL